MNNTHSKNETRYVRVRSIVGDRKSGAPGILPIGESTWWRGVKDGRYPAPIKLSAGVTAWRLEDVLAVANRD